MRLKVLAVLVAAMGLVVYGVMDRWLSYSLGATAGIALLVVLLVCVLQNSRGRSSAPPA